MASLKPKLFCGVAFIRTGVPSSRARVGATDPEAGYDACNLRHNTCQTTAQKISRATPPHRQNQPDVALFTSDCESETGNYKDQVPNCQARTARARESVLISPS